MKLTRRVARLEGPLVDGHLAPGLRAMAVEVAMELELEAAAVIAEMTIILKEAAAAGALGSTEALEAFLAQQSAWFPSIMEVDSKGGEA